MNSIHSTYARQAGQINQSSTLRSAKPAGDLPKLTQDETSLINKKFSAGDTKAMNLYSIDGTVNQQGHARGRNIDTRI